MEDNDFNDFYKPLDNDEDEWILDAEKFNDENIQEVVKKYNYDYKYLLRELSLYIDYNTLLEILNTLGIAKNEYLNPTYETFEKIRSYAIKENLIDNENSSL